MPQWSNKQHLITSDAYLTTDEHRWLSDAAYLPDRHRITSDVEFKRQTDSWILHRLVFLSSIRCPKCDQKIPIPEHFPLHFSSANERHVS